MSTTQDVLASIEYLMSTAPHILTTEEVISAIRTLPCFSQDSNVEGDTRPKRQRNESIVESVNNLRAKRQCTPTPPPYQITCSFIDIPLETRTRCSIRSCDSIEDLVDVYDDIEIISMDGDENDIDIIYIDDAGISREIHVEDHIGWSLNDILPLVFSGMTKCGFNPDTELTSLSFDSKHRKLMTTWKSDKPIIHQ